MLRGTVWVELLIVLAVAAVVALFPAGGFRIDEYVIVAGLFGGALVVVAAGRMLWFRERLAALLDDEAKEREGDRAQTWNELQDR